MAPASSLLRIELHHVIGYVWDISDPTQFATYPDPTTALPVKNFTVGTLIADIWKVNDTLVKGTYFSRAREVNAKPHPDPGDAIADVTRAAIREDFFEILNSDNSAIGTIMCTGLSGGAVPPGTGSPPIEHGNYFIVGGTGAYLGVSGQMVGHGNQPWLSSIIEDPSYRRHPSHHGTTVRYDLRVIPADPPQIMTTAFGPLVLHYLHGMPVNALNPAVADEELVVFASGLGPTNPDVPLDLPFPPPALPSLVNSPLTVSLNDGVNDIDAQVLAKFGVPGTVNTYSVRFKMPASVTPPVASLRLTAAWISGPPVNISVA